MKWPRIAHLSLNLWSTRTMSSRTSIGLATLAIALSSLVVRLRKNAGIQVENAIRVESEAGMTGILPSPRSHRCPSVDPVPSAGRQPMCVVRRIA